MREANPPDDKRRSRVRSEAATIPKAESSADKSKGTQSRAKKPSGDPAADLTAVLASKVVGQPAVIRVIVFYI